jgi:hypothetical protein
VTSNGVRCLGYEHYESIWLSDLAIRFCTPVPKSDDADVSRDQTSSPGELQQAHQTNPLITASASRTRSHQCGSWSDGSAITVQMLCTSGRRVATAKLVIVLRTPAAAEETAQPQKLNVTAAEWRKGSKGCNSLAGRSMYFAFCYSSNRQIL